MKILVVKNEYGQFIPAYDSDRELAKKVKVGEERIFECKTPRNIKFHKKFFALLKLVLENNDYYDTIEQLLIEIKLKTGYYDIHVTLKGVDTYIPRSISFESMDGEEFEKFYNDAVNIVLKYFLKGVTEEQIERELVNFL